jgi:hypothetical protein
MSFLYSLPVNLLPVPQFHSPSYFHHFVYKYFKDNYLAGCRTDEVFYILAKAPLVEENISWAKLANKTLKSQHLVTGLVQIDLMLHICLQTTCVTNEKNFAREIELEEVGELLERKIGIVPVPYSSHVLKIEENSDTHFSIQNRFSISGKWQIINNEKFNRALHTGVGMRKSYGFGAIILK